MGGRREMSSGELTILPAPFGAKLPGGVCRSGGIGYAVRGGWEKKKRALKGCFYRMSLGGFVLEG